MHQDGYIIDQELIKEMIRLKRQATVITEAMGGTLPELSDQDISSLHTVLDLACGPGEWVMALTRAHSHISALGVDNSTRMIEYAHAQCENDHASFREMSIKRYPLDFPDASFDLVNGRFLMGLMKTHEWLPLLQECFRLLKPGGLVRITEAETGAGTDETYQRYNDLWATAWHKAGHLFSYGPGHTGITVAMKGLMMEAGFIAPQHRPISIDLSFDQPVHEAVMSDIADLLLLGSPFLLKYGDVTQEQIDMLQKDMATLVNKQGFRAYWVLQTIWGYKP